MVALQGNNVQVKNFGFLEENKKSDSILKKIHKYLKVFKEIYNEDKSKQTILLYYGRFNLPEVIFFPLLRKQGLKIVIDIVEDNTLDAYKKNAVQKINQFISKILLKKFNTIIDGFVVVSQHLKFKIKEISKDQQSIYLLPAIIETKKVLHGSKNKNRNKKLTLFYGGNYGVKENISTVLNVFNRLCILNKKICLILTGIPDSASKRIIKNNIKNNKRIIFKGYLARKQYDSVIKKSDLFIVPRKNIPYALAGFPFKLAEFMASGKPVLCSENIEIKKIIPRNSVLFFNPDSEIDFYEKALCLIQSGSLRRKIGSSGRLTAAKKFGRETQGLKLKKWLITRILR